MKIDFTSPKVLIPTVLFAALSPGLLLSLPSLKISSMTTSKESVFIHALVLMIVYFLLVKLKVVPFTITKADLVVPAVLFVLLSPTILPIFKSTGLTPIALSTVVFAIVFALLRANFPQYY